MFSWKAQETHLLKNLHLFSVCINKGPLVKINRNSLWLILAERNLMKGWEVAKKM